MSGCFVLDDVREGGLEADLEGAFVDGGFD